MCAQRFVVPKRVELHEEATVEAEEAAAWYDERDPDTAEEFAQELARALATVGQAPDRWPIERGRARRYLFKRFPFKLVYVTDEDRVFVLAVAHKRRKPGYWKDRA